MYAYRKARISTLTEEVGSDVIMRFKRGPFQFGSVGPYAGFWKGGYYGSTCKTTPIGARKMFLDVLNFRWILL